MVFFFFPTARAPPVHRQISLAVQGFFKSIVDKDAVGLAQSILGCDLTGQPFVKDKAAFVEECRLLWDKQYVHMHEST